MVSQIKLFLSITKIIQLESVYPETEIYPSICSDGVEIQFGVKYFLINKWFPFVFREFPHPQSRIGMNGVVPAYVQMTR